VNAKEEKVMTGREKAGDWRSFFLLWCGQVVSLLGSGLTAFGLGVWIYQRTGSVAQFALVLVVGSVPGLLIGPLAGALIDRWDRRRVMLLANLGAAAATLALIVLLAQHRLALWHVYVVVAFGATCGYVLNPAFGATIPLLLPKDHLGRASGMMQLGPAAARILSPLAAGFLLPAVGLRGLIAIDMASFVFAAAMVLLIRIPRVAHAPSAGPRQGLLRQAGYGWSYIKARPGFVSLLAFFAILNLLFSFCLVLTTPLVLSFGSPAVLGLVLSLASAGMLAGSLVMSAWGGPRRRMYGILGFAPLLGASFLMIGTAHSVALLTAGIFLLFFVIPIINGCDEAIWQAKVERQALGRVIATAQLLSQFTAPIAFLLAGPLSDRLFEPMMRPGGALAGSLGRFLGVGPGRGIALLFVVMGLLLLLAAASGFLYPRLRSLEDEIPDAAPPPAGPVPEPVSQPLGEQAAASA
jgi:DHA3 family macrolide efflux protein-like MFS transporter